MTEKARVYCLRTLVILGLMMLYVYAYMFGD